MRLHSSCDISSGIRLAASDLAEVDRLDDATLSRCLGLAANGTQPPDVWSTDTRQL